MNYDKIYPVIDLHGEYSFSAEVLVKEFIDDNINLKKRKLVIIHGIGKGILKDTVHKVLKSDKRIERFYIDFMNPGSTIVEIRKEYYE
jgi:dsDNA-specific endonuclease/ATPase MutS2